MSANDAGSWPESNPAPASQPTASLAISESEVAKRFWERVRLFALRRLSDASAAEDIAQEVIRRVVEALRADRVRSMASLPSFVFQTAQHVILHQHRGAGREVRALQRMQAGAEGTTSGDFLTLLISEERRHTVRAALAKLVAEDRDLLTRLYQEQLEPAEIAQAFGITPGALRVRKHRALKRLADLLGGPAGNDS